MYALEVITYVIILREDRKLLHSQKNMFLIRISSPKILPLIHSLYCVGITSPLRTLYCNRGYISSF